MKKKEGGKKKNRKNEIVGYLANMAERRFGYGRRVREMLAGVRQLSKHEEAELAALIKEGGKSKERAANLLISTHMYVPVVLALRKCSLSEATLEDLIQEGCLGLHAAADIFSSDKARFSTLAYHFVNGFQNCYMTDKSRVLRIPSNQIRCLNGKKKYENVHSALAKQAAKLPKSLDDPKVRDIFESIAPFDPETKFVDIELNKQEKELLRAMYGIDTKADSAKSILQKLNYD